MGQNASFSMLYMLTDYIIHFVCGAHDVTSCEEGGVGGTWGKGTVNGVV